MLNKILKSLNGHSVEPAAVAEALAQLGRDRDAVRGEIAALNERRRQALLDDASDAELDKIERAIDRANVRLEKLTLAERPLRDQLATAQENARRAAEPGLIAEYRAAFDDYASSLRAIAGAHRRQSDIRARAIALLGESRAKILLPPFAYVGELTHEFVTMWMERNDAELTTSAGVRPVGRAATRPVSRAAAPPTPPTPSPEDATRLFLAYPKAPQPTLQHLVTLARDPVPAKNLTAARAADDEAPLESDQARVVVLTSGWSPADNKPACRAGQVVRLPIETARAAAKRGVIEIIETFSAPGTAPTQGEGASAP